MNNKKTNKTRYEEAVEKNTRIFKSIINEKRWLTIKISWWNYSCSNKYKNKDLFTLDQDVFEASVTKLIKEANKRLWITE